MVRRILSAEEIAERNQPFECGADVLKAFLKSVHELEDYDIDVVELGDGGVEVFIGNSTYAIERTF
ncbi:MAG: hypothetical protein IJ168_05595 [Eubacterium sp.]|nr:hypothetical protein [Eubacterium sp.]